MNVSVDMLKAKMMVFKNCLPTNFSFDDVKKNIQKVTFPNLYKFIQVGITIPPISSATCERSFSSMRRIKNWLRTSMLQQRFSNLSILNIERKITKNLKSEQILNKFNLHSRKIMLK